MFTITGGIQFKKGQDLPDKIKEHIKKEGILSPFNPDNFWIEKNKDFIHKQKDKDGNIKKNKSKNNKEDIISLKI